MKTKVSLGLNAMSVSELLGFGTHVVTKMTGNGYFTNPSPSLGTVNASLYALQVAYDQAQGAGPGQTAVMYQKRELFQQVLTALGHYVEDVANEPVNSTTGAEVIILSAGMNVRTIKPRHKQVFAAVSGELPGTVVLTAAAIKRGSHQWQYALDLTDQSEWTDAEPTVQATTIISGLQSVKRFYFRHRTVVKGGPTAWEDAINAIVP